MAAAVDEGDADDDSNETLPVDSGVSTIGVDADESEAMAQRWCVKESESVREEGEYKDKVARKGVVLVVVEI